MSVEETIFRMIKAMDAGSEADLLRKTGLSSGAIAQWKKRDKVTDKGISIVSELSGYNFRWLKDGTGPMRPETQQVAEPIPEYQARDDLDAIGRVLIEQYITLSESGKLKALQAVTALKIEENESNTVGGRSGRDGRDQQNQAEKKQTG